MTATPTLTPPTVTRDPPPRRNWLVLGLAAVLLSFAAGAVGWWIGSGSDDTAKVAEELPEIIVDYYNAYVEGDSAALGALFTEDGILTFPLQEHVATDGGDLSSPGTISSPDAIAFSLQLWFYYVDYTEVEYLDVIADPNTIVVVTRWDGMSSTHRRPSKTPFSATVVDVFELRDGLISRCDAYYEYDEVVT